MYQLPCNKIKPCGLCEDCRIARLKRAHWAFIITIGAILLFATFLPFINAHAAIPDQTTFSSGQSSYQFHQTLSDNNGDISGVISGVTLRGQGYNNNILSNGVIVEICSDATCGTILASDTQTWGYNWIGAPNVVEAHFTWAPITIPANSAGMCMRVTTDSGGDSFYNMHYEGTGTDSDYPFGSGSAVSCGGTISGFKDLYMVWDTPAGPEITLVSPADDLVDGIPDFNYFHVSGANFSSSSPINLQIYYGSTDGPDFPYFSIREDLEIEDDGTFNTAVGKGLPLGNGIYEWYARAYTTSTITTSTISNFVIIPADIFSTSTNPYFDISTSTFAGYCSGGALSFITEPTKILFCAFYPTATSVSQFGDIRTELAQKPPFGYITLASDQLGDLSTSTAAFSIPTSSAMMTSVITPIRTAIAWLLYFLFIIWMFHRFRKAKV